ncbi:MAG: toprim domain-containing protein [Alphaproteobacteria bacterium]|nr:toprim domain-containing protein [Alphaproteobacteria bacterium]
MSEAARIAAALGGKKTSNGFMARCPAHEDKTPSLSIADGHSGTVLRCFAGCSQAEVMGALRAKGLWGSEGGGSGKHTGHRLTDKERADMRAAQERAERREAEDKRVRAAQARDIWKTAKPAKETAAQTYLATRGITIPLSSRLRFDHLRHSPTGLTFPSMIAAASDRDDHLVAIQRTFLQAGGKGKAQVSAPRMTLGPISGACVRLTPIAAKLHIAESVEDAMSLTQLFGIAAWATLGTAGFENLDLPAKVTTVVLCPDGDAAGDAAIEKAGNRLADQGRTVDTMQAPRGSDWNELLIDTDERAAICQHDGGQCETEAMASAISEAAQ